MGVSRKRTVKKSPSKKKSGPLSFLRSSKKPINDKLVVIFPDIHFPYHDEQAVECAVRAHAALRPARTVQLGDALDCAVFSSHPSKRLSEKAHDFLMDEVRPARAFTDRCMLNTRKFIQMGGNHEYRTQRKCIEWGQVGLSLHGLVDPERLLGEGRSRNEWQYIPYVHSTAPVSYYDICKTLIAVHGWSFAKNAAKVHLDATRDKSVIFGHTHRQQSASTRNPFTGQVLRAWSSGTLSSLQPLYHTDGKPTEWVHGFSIVYISSDGMRFSEYSITIENGACVLPDGTQIKV